jgi:hypothetical protein
MDIFANKMWYSYQDTPYEFVEMNLGRVKEILDENKKGEVVAELKEYQDIPVVSTPDYANVVGQDDLTRFDQKNQKGKNKRRKNNSRKNRNKNNRPNPNNKS